MTPPAARPVKIIPADTLVFAWCYMLAYGGAAWFLPYDSCLTPLCASAAVIFFVLPILFAIIERKRDR